MKERETAFLHGISKKEEKKTAFSKEKRVSLFSTSLPPPSLGLQKKELKSLQIDKQGLVIVKVILNKFGKMKITRLSLSKVKGKDDAVKICFEFSEFLMETFPSDVR